VPPILDEVGRVTNLNDSSLLTVSQDIAMDPSPWVLIVGAAVGGVLCYFLQVVVGAARLNRPDRLAGWGIAFWFVTRQIPWFVGGLIGAVLVAGVGTVLLQRLSTSEFLVAVKVQDVWGAIATGFILQGLGYPRLRRLFVQVDNPPREETRPAAPGTPEPRTR
jgi:hypothetical protein